MPWALGRVGIVYAAGDGVMHFTDEAGPVPVQYRGQGQRDREPLAAIAPPCPEAIRCRCSGSAGGAGEKMPAVEIGAVEIAAKEQCALALFRTGRTPWP